MIPYTLFTILYEQLDHVEALDQLRATYAGALGQQMAENGNDAKIKRVRKRLEADAFPRVLPVGDADAFE